MTNLYECEIRRPKVKVGTLPVGAHFAFESGKEFEVVAQFEMGTSIRKTGTISVQFVDKATGKSKRIVGRPKPRVISADSEVTQTA